MSREVENEILQLKSLISKYDVAYHQNDNPLVSDSEYDDLKNKLIKFEKLYPQFFKEHEFNNIGAKSLDIFNKIKHYKPMLSLANGFSRDDIVDFIEKIERFLGLSKDRNSSSDFQSNLFEPELFSKNDNPIDFFSETKIDGLSFSARYEKGILKYCATRGDGYEGEDVTENAKTIKNFPHILKDIDPPSFIEVRGEIFMSKRFYRTQ